MGSKLLKSLMSVVLVIGLMPTLALADDTTNSGTLATGSVIGQGNVLVGATGSVEASTRQASTNDVTYKITLNDDGETYTLTFDGNGEIPTYRTESQGTAIDGTEGVATPPWKVADTDETEYPNGYVEDSNGAKHALPSESQDLYRYCTKEIAYYNAVPWRATNANKYGSKITNVVFGEGVTKIGMYTLFNMTAVTHVTVKNPTCKIDNSAIYFNGANGSPCVVDIASTVDKGSKIYGSAGNSSADVSIKVSDAAAFEDEASAAIAALNLDNLTAEQKEQVKNYYNRYLESNTVFKDALSADFKTQLQKAYAAATGADSGQAVWKEGAVQNGANSYGTIHYQLLTSDAGNTYTLRFYESAENGDGKMADFAIKDNDKETVNDLDKYQNAPWYTEEIRNKITKVVYDKSITRTGYLTACHFYNCREFVFENPDVVIASTTIHWNDQIKADHVSIIRYASAKMETDGGNIYWANTSKGVNADVADRISFVYTEAEQYKEAYASLFATDSLQATKEDVTAAKSAFDALAAECRVQLSSDKIPDGSMTYLEKLNALAKQFGLGESDSRQIIKDDVIPSSNGAAETTRYEISTTDGGRTYTVRFYNPNGNGVIPNYSTAKEPAWADYTKLPWKAMTYNSKVVKMVFEDSVVNVGQFAAANMSGCTDFVIEGNQAKLHRNAIYFNYGSDAAASGVTIHAYAAINPTYGYNNAADRFGGSGAAERIHYSYIEAEQFESSADYGTLWTLDKANALSQSALIEQAYVAYGSLPDKAKEQLNSDVIADSETTYFGKLSELMAAIGKGGDCGDRAQYVVSNNNDGTYTLTISGSGAVTKSPWTGYASSISKVVLSSGIESVSAGVFANLAALKSVDVAESVTDIAEGAFPATAQFAVHGWLNHASGKYCESHSNAQLKLKELRILAMGNSHTGDYTQFLNNVINDMADGGMKTKISFERLYPMGGRGLYVEQGDRSSHYAAAHSKDANMSKPYTDAFAKTWDIVVAQDYHESTMLNKDYGGAGYASDMKEVVSWLRGSAKGAQIVWFADWAEKSANGTDKLDQTYAQSVAAINAVEALGEDGPDHIVAAATVLQNARTSYLGSTMNPSDVIANNTKADGGYIFSDYAKGDVGKYTVLERDATHMSLELGRQLMATNFAYDIVSWLGDKMDVAENFNVLDSIKTAPEYKSGETYWQGEFTDDVWNVVKESVRNAVASKLSVTNSRYTADPFIAKQDNLKEVLQNVVLPDELSQESLESAFKADSVVAAINEIGFSNEVTADDIAVAYAAPVNGTADNGGAGTDGKVEVSVKCHYGYSFPTGPAYTKDLPAASTLQYKIDTAANGATVQLDANTVEAITIPAGKSITLDLNGYKLVNSATAQDKDFIGIKQHTITNNGTLWIVDSSQAKTGVVDNVSHGRAALYNNAGASATVSAGKFMRSAEAGANANDNGGNSWYTIKNYGIMTINGDSVNVMASKINVGRYSSLVSNGWFNASKAPSNGEPERASSSDATLTISDGIFDGGLNTVKNDDYGVLNISGGTLTNQVQAAVMNWNVASITGGKFSVAEGADAVFLNGAVADASTVDSGQLTVSGGSFIAPEGTTLIEQTRDDEGYAFGSATVSGGTFKGSFPTGLPSGASGLTVTGGTFSDQTFDEYCETGKGPEENTSGAGEAYAVGNLPAVPAGSEAKVDVLGKYKGTRTTWLVPEGGDNEVFAGWYQDEGLTQPCSSDQLNGVAYAKFVKLDAADGEEGLINWLGNSLRTDLQSTYGFDQTFLRFSYKLNVPADATLNKSGKTGWAIRFNDNGAEGEWSKFLPETLNTEDYKGGIRSNAVFKNIAKTKYESRVYEVRMIVSYTTGDGTNVNVADLQSHSRSVFGLATAIKSNPQTDADRTYAEGIISAVDKQ